LLLVKSAGPSSLPQWQQAFARLLPGLDVRWWDDATVDPASVRYALVWQPAPGFLASLPNLDVIFSSGAGVDHILADPRLPAHLPIVRMGADELAQTVSEYVAMAALMALRDQPRMAKAHSAVTWEYFEPPRTAHATTVGILGLGTIGVHTAAVLSGIGFRVLGWSRTQKTVAGVASHSGADGLDEVLARSHILVSLLPDTTETRHLMNRERLRHLPRGAAVINVGRGSAIVLEDLLAVVREGHIRHAMLDVFEHEPLPEDHAAWRTDGVMVTSHVAGYATVPAKAAYVAGAIAAYRRGLPLPNLYDAERGY
jgi:glyoxylate/hydroxypyruvate reductase A